MLNVCLSVSKLLPLSDDAPYDCRRGLSDELFDGNGSCLNADANGMGPASSSVGGKPLLVRSLLGSIDSLGVTGLDEVLLGNCETPSDCVCTGAVKTGIQFLS